MRSTILAAALLAATALPAAAQDARQPFSDTLSGVALVEALRAGGHILYIRHARTEREGADQVSAVMGDCSTQRMLSADGWRDARTIGAALTLLEVPVGVVVSSQYCRAWQTAQVAFGRHVETPALNFEPAETYSETQVTAMRDRVRPLLTAMPPHGTNTALVGHDDPFEAATGLYPEPMGVTVVVRPDGRGGFDLVADLTPDELLALVTAR